MKQLLASFFLVLSFNSFSQQRDGEAFQRDYKYNVEKTSETIRIDGELNEAVWATSPKAGNFWMKYPNDEGRPKRKTEVVVAFDDKFIYFGFTAYDSGKAFIQSLKRDNGHDGNDCVGIIIDPTNQRANGFFFVVNAFNTQSEDQLPFSNDNDGQGWTWDNSWFSATKRYKDKWTAEIAIPFKTLRYEVNKLLWGINFLRVDTKSNEYSVWTHVPVNFPSHSLLFTGALQWKTSPPSAGSSTIVIPYITGGLNKDKENSGSLKSTANAGFDAKLALSSSMNLDITANPDFSQIEVDRQVTNLTRFSIFFPERRTFFLENADLFAAHGYPDIRPFYSRTIGLDKDLNRVPIIAGARLTGNIDKSTRIGLMTMQTARTNNAASQNYSAASINKRILKNSIVRAYFLDHENFISEAEKKKNPIDAYGRNAGIKFNYSDLPGKWQAWFGYNKSFKKGVDNKDVFIQTGAQYNVRNFKALINYGGVGTNYYTDMGFVGRILNYDAEKDTSVRLGFKELYSQLTYQIYPIGRKVTQHNIDFSHYVVYNPDNSVNENNVNLNYFMQFQNTGNVFVNFNHSHVNLLFPTSFTDSAPLPRGSYTYNSGEAGFGTDFRKPFSFNLSGEAGSFYNGTYRAVRGGINFRRQPHLNISINAQYNKLKFPKQYGETELFLVATRVEFNLNTNLFWTTFLQYNTQRNNFNINSRLQYRFRPMSDFFLVYTDNYFTDPLFKNRNRAVVFKMNYWLNL